MRTSHKARCGRSKAQATRRLASYLMFGTPSVEKLNMEWCHVEEQIVVTRFQCHKVALGFQKDHTVFTW